MHQFQKHGADIGATNAQHYERLADAFLVLKNTGLAAIGFDLVVQTGFAVVTMGAATVLFRRTL